MIHDHDDWFTVLTLALTRVAYVKVLVRGTWEVSDFDRLIRHLVQMRNDARARDRCDTSFAAAIAAWQAEKRP